MKKIAVLFFMLVFVTPLTNIEASFEEVESPSLVYRFHEHLSEAEALILRPRRERLVGNWQVNHFEFPELGNKGKVSEVPLVIEETVYRGIRIDPVRKATTRLRFPSVPPSAKLVLTYGVDKEKEIKETAYVYFQVWLGKHRLKRFRVSSEDGWRRESFDLGVASFLNKDIVVTFLAKADMTEGVRFTIIPEMHR